MSRATVSPVPPSEARCTAAGGITAHAWVGCSVPGSPGNNSITPCRQRTQTTEQTGLSIASCIPCCRQHSPGVSLKAPSPPKYTVPTSLTKSSGVCDSFGKQWQFVLPTLDPQPPPLQNRWGHLILWSAGLKASRTLLPAVAKQTLCMAETASPANSLGLDSSVGREIWKTA